MLGRRRFIRGAALFTAGLLADQALEITAFDPIKERLAPDPRSMACTDLAPERFARYASLEMQAALAFWRRGDAEYPAVVSDRTTRTYRGPDGRRWMERQGERIRLFGREPLRMTNIPMAEQPDGEYGAWAADRLDRCELRAEPTFQKCRGVVRTNHGPVVQTYFALLLPRAGGVVDSITEKVA